MSKRINISEQLFESIKDHIINQKCHRPLQYFHEPPGGCRLFVEDLWPAMFRQFLHSGTMSRQELFRNLSLLLCPRYCMVGAHVCRIAQVSERFAQYIDQMIQSSGAACGSMQTLQRLQQFLEPMLFLSGLELANTFEHFYRSEHHNTSQWLLPC